jgi:hypothetical protein
MNVRCLLFALIILAVLTVACTPAMPSPQLSPLAVVSPLSSPVVAPSNSVAFQLDRPILAGATIVRGSGPAGVPVYISDITFMGEPLGTGTIGPDNRFAITVQSLDAGHRIGLALGELSGSQFKPEQFYPIDFHGPGAMQFPMVGFFFDTTTISEK